MEICTSCFCLLSNLKHRPGEDAVGAPLRASWSRTEHLGMNDTQAHPGLGELILGKPSFWPGWHHAMRSMRAMCPVEEATASSPAITESGVKRGVKYKGRKRGHLNSA